MLERGGFEESRGETVGRRLKTIGSRVVGLVAVTALFPALLAVALVLDLVCFLWVYLAAEAVGLLALLGVWVAAGFGRRRERIREWTWRFQQVWAGWLFAAVRGLFGLRLEVAGEEL